MLRRTLVAVPFATTAAALLAVLLPPVAAVACGLLLGLAVAVWISGVAEGRIARVTDRVLSFTGGQRQERLRPEGSPQWRRLTTALNVVSEELSARIDALVDERARVQRLLDDLPLGVLLFGPDGLVYANPTADRLLAHAEPGTPPEGALQDPDLVGAVREAADSGRTVAVEVAVGERSLAATASPMRAEEVALVLADVSPIRRVEAMRRDFVTNASHELKTPVAAMQALADSLLLALERDPDRARTMVRRLHGEAGRLAQLVRDLLDLARLEERASERAAPIDLGEVIGGQVDRLAALARERKVSVHLDLVPGATVVAVPEEVRTIVANLLENAVRYNVDGGQVHVRCSRQRGEVVLEVRDTGVGIPAAAHERVFERFYRVDQGRSRAEGGTGLGLSLVRNAVDRQGGSIRLESPADGGSRFVVTLPVDGREAGRRPRSGGYAAPGRGTPRVTPTRGASVSQERTRFPVTPQERHQTAKSSEDIAVDDDLPTSDATPEATDPRTRVPSGEDEDKPGVPPHERHER